MEWKLSRFGHLYAIDAMGRIHNRRHPTSRPDSPHSIEADSELHYTVLGDARTKYNLGNGNRVILAKRPAI